MRRVRGVGRKRSNLVSTACNVWSRFQARGEQSHREGQTSPEDLKCCVPVISGSPGLELLHGACVSQGFFFESSALKSAAKLSFLSRTLYSLFIQIPAVLHITTHLSISFSILTTWKDSEVRLCSSLLNYIPTCSGAMKRSPSSKQNKCAKWEETCSHIFRRERLTVQETSITVSVWSVGVLPMTPMGMIWQEREWEILVKKWISFAFVEENAAALATVPLKRAQGNQDSLLLSSRH